MVFHLTCNLSALSKAFHDVGFVIPFLVLLISMLCRQHISQHGMFLKFKDVMLCETPCILVLANCFISNLVSIAGQVLD